MRQQLQGDAVDGIDRSPTDRLMQRSPSEKRLGDVHIGPLLQQGVDDGRLGTPAHSAHRGHQGRSTLRGTGVEVRARLQQRQHDRGRFVPRRPVQGGGAPVIRCVHVRPGLQQGGHDGQILVLCSDVEWRGAGAIQRPGAGADSQQQRGDCRVRVGGRVVEDSVAVVVRGTDIGARLQAGGVDREVGRQGEDRRVPELAAGRIGDQAVVVARERIGPRPQQFLDRSRVDPRRLPGQPGAGVAPGAVQRRVAAGIGRVEVGPSLQQSGNDAGVRV